MRFSGKVRSGAGLLLGALLGLGLTTAPTAAQTWVGGTGAGPHSWNVNSNWLPA